MSAHTPKRPARPAQRDDFADSDFVFRPATKERAMARVAIQGVSGSGKTWTSLALAHGLGGSIAVIDTERGAASKYVGVNGVQFDQVQLSSYDPRHLVRALAAAGSAGYGTVLIDSLSHFWNGTDGTLAQVERAKSKYGGNSFAGWKDATPMQNDMIDALLAYPGHVIATMRAKTDWVLQDNPHTGRREPVMMGLAAEQRKGVEYEFDVVASMDVENTLTVLKSRCPSLHRRVIQEPDGAAIATDLLKWLDDGTDGAETSEYITRATAEDATYESLVALHHEVEGRGLLATPMLNRAGEPTSLGEYIRTRGSGLKAAGGTP